MIPRFRPPHTMRDLGVLFTRKKSAESIAEFESAFARVAGQRHARVFPYGRTALVAVLEYLKEKSEPSKTEVICPSYTCVVVAHAIVEAGLNPVFVDSEESTLNMDWAYVHQAVSSKTLAVISTSLFGNPVRKSDIDDFRTKFPGVFVVQDCAHSFFAGDIHREGVAAIYGMNVSKIVTSVFGGMVSTDDKNLAEWLRVFQNEKLVSSTSVDRFFRSLYFVGSLVAFSPPVYWLTFLLQRAGILARFVNYYRPDSIDFPKDAYRQIGSVEASLALRQINNYADEVRRRISVAKIYDEALSVSSSVDMIRYGAQPTYSHYVVKTNYAEKISKRLASKRIELGRIVDYDIASLPVYAGAPYFGKGLSRTAPEMVLNLPLHRGVTLSVARNISRDFVDVLGSVESK